MMRLSFGVDRTNWRKISNFFNWCKPMRTIYCKSCHAKFIPHEMDDFAYGCASVANDNGLIGKRGSFLDGKTISFSRRPEWVKNGIICDVCIVKVKEHV